MIEFDDVTITYADQSAPVLANVNLRIPEGELVLVVGRTGSGKSTLLSAVNGLVPHFTGGTLREESSWTGGTLLITRRAISRISWAWCRRIQ